MNSVLKSAERLLATAQDAGLSWDQTLVSLGLAAKMLSRQPEFLAAHPSPIAHGRKCLNRGFDRQLEDLDEVVRRALPTISATMDGKTVPLHKCAPNEVSMALPAASKKRKGA